MDKAAEGCEILPMTNTIAISDMNVLRALLSNLPSQDNTAAEAAIKAEKAGAKAAKKMATKIAAAETKLAAARSEAEGNIVTVAAEAAMDTAQQLAGVKATKAQAEKAVNAAAKANAAQGAE